MRLPNEILEVSYTVEKNHKKTKVVLRFKEDNINDFLKYIKKTLGTNGKILSKRALKLNGEWNKETIEKCLRNWHNTNFET